MKQKSPAKNKERKVLSCRNYFVKIHKNLKKLEMQVAR